MQSRLLEINVISATELENVRHIGEMRVFAVVSISGEAQPEQRTDVDKGGGINPTWNKRLNFTIDNFAAEQNRLTLMFRLRCERTLGDKDIGTVCVPVRELRQNGAFRDVRRGVTLPTGTIQGELNFSYRLGRINDAANPPPQLAPVNRCRRMVRVVTEAVVYAAASLGLGAAFGAATDNIASG